MGTLDGLLRIKEFRESRAERAVAHARLELEKAEEHLQKARQNLRRYLAQCEERERELYADLLSRLVHKSDFDDVDAEIKAMREKIPEYEKAVEDAIDARKRAEHALQDARAAHQLALRMREKFSELVAMERRSRAAQVLRAEELELEELRAPVRGDAAQDMESEEAAA